MLNSGCDVSLAYCEIRLILCKLLWHFDIALCAESADWTDQKVYFLWDKPALKVMLRDRFSGVDYGLFGAS